MADEGGEIEKAHRTPPLSPGVNKGVSTTVHKGSAQRAQALSPSVNTQQTVTNTKTDKVVNSNDHRKLVRNRSTAGRNPVISDLAIRAKYQLNDDQIGRVHWLVQKQIETLGAASRNHAFYVKRAAEAVRDGHDTLLDQKLSELKQAAIEIGIGSRPAYFHAMYTEALEKNAGETKVPVVPVAIPADRRRGPEPVGDLFGPPDNEADDSRSRMLADAEHRGFTIPDYIRKADTSAVNRWWASLIDGKPAT